jgi:hypothetical protein
MNPAPSEESHDLIKDIFVKQVFNCLLAIEIDSLGGLL